MTHVRWTALLVLISAIVLILAISTGGSAAPRPQATPPAGQDVPGPDECTIAPRTLPLLAATSAAPPATQQTPFATPAGEPASDEIARAITATVRESLACRNAGDFLRAYALFSDRFLQERFSGEDAISPELARALEETPVAVPVARQLALIEISGIQLLADERAGALVLTSNAEEAFADYLFFVRVDDRWLIDQVVFLSDTDLGTPAA